MDKTIMIIEDDRETQFLFTTLLEGEGYNVLPFDNGTEALKTLKEKLVDLIFMDLNFPDGTPEEFMAHLKQIDGSDKIPVIVVSGSTEIEDYTRRLNAKTYIKKPFEIDPLLKLIEETI